MRCPCAQYTKADLHGDIGQHIAPRDAATRRDNQRDGRIEMRARYWPQHRNQDDQHRRRRHRVAQQCDSNIPARQLLRHDARTNDGSEQQE